MHQQTVIGNQQQIKLDVSDYTQGMYQVVLKGDGIISTKKMIIR